MNTQLKAKKRARRKARVRSKIAGTFERPRLTVFRSNRYVSAQLIDDTKGVTLASATSKGMGKQGIESARATGMALAKLAGARGISSTVFDKNGYIFTGKVKALADGAREGGLQF